jgi:hypothetical protein
MKNDMQVKQEIMEQELDQVAGGAVNVKKVVDTVTTVVDTISKVMPNKKKDGGSPQAPETTTTPSVTQDTSNNTQIVNHNNVNGPNQSSNITFGAPKKAS